MKQILFNPAVIVRSAIIICKTSLPGLAVAMSFFKIKRYLIESYEVEIKQYVYITNNWIYFVFYGFDN